MARKLLDWWSTADLAWKKCRPHEFVSQVEELRGELRSNWPRGRVSGTKEYTNEPGRYDEKLDAWLWAYKTSLQSIVDACDELRMLEQRVLGVMSRDEATRLLVAAEAGKDAKFECANCKEIFTRTRKQRPRSGRCRACYQWRRNHAGEERPIERSVA